MALRDIEERALELSQRGYSSSGIARELDVTEATARKYLKTIESELGEEALVNHNTYGNAECSEIHG